MKTIKILAVGQIKEPHWQKAASHYQKRLGHTAKLDLHTIKDAPAKLPAEARMEHESERLAALVKPTDVTICLDDTGRNLTSKEFASFLQSLYDYGATPCFMVGGAYGLSPSLKKQTRHIISLSPMTFTHEMAFVILLEQLYRTEMILLGTGYHHG